MEERADTTTDGDGKTIDFVISLARTNLASLEDETGSGLVLGWVEVQEIITRCPLAQ